MKNKLNDTQGGRSDGQIFLEETIDTFLSKKIFADVYLEHIATLFEGDKQLTF